MPNPGDFFSLNWSLAPLMGAASDNYLLKLLLFPTISFFAAFLFIDLFTLRIRLFSFDLSVKNGFFIVYYVE